MKRLVHLPRTAATTGQEQVAEAVVRLADAAPEDPPPEFFTVHAGDALRLDMFLSRYSSARRPLLTATITSPPYGGRKDYGHPGQIGFGQPSDEYLLDVRRVFRALHTHTKPDGALWVVADTLREKPPGGGVWPLQLLPFQLAGEASKVGWILRDVIIWVKDKTLPWSSRGRMRNEFEYVLFFVKSEKFKYHVDRLRAPTDLEHWWVRYPERYNPQGKAPANVWAVPIPVQGSWANTTIQHACPLPADLVERMLLLSTDDEDVVLDPFAGSGVVVAEAQRLGRRGFGVELIERHVEAFRSTVLPEITERRGVDILEEQRSRREDLERTIVDLRTVKYPKMLMLGARDGDDAFPKPFAIYGLRRPKRDWDDRVALEVVVVLEDDDRGRADECLNALARAARRKPASKFGIAPELRVASKSELSRLHRGRPLWAYVAGRTHRAHGRCRTANVAALAALPSRHRVPLIVSNVYVDEKPRRLSGVVP